MQIQGLWKNNSTLLCTSAISELDTWHVSSRRDVTPSMNSQQPAQTLFHAADPSWLKPNYKCSRAPRRSTKIRYLLLEIDFGENMHWAPRSKLSVCTSEVTKARNYMALDQDNRQRDETPYAG
ncbi:hypothetical protein H0G86_000428 [Trichoderma simmonsii]|uniref:Uncharacterized protein n=1 Tax=Trichoderma simmonsii TaxID=1491479 RepID=A0A8G0L4K7_9HYPO|nr:hypothetical protein H0G86_000428 [Trichoderma simmonsii]